MVSIIELMPMLQGDELAYIRNVVKDLNEDQLRLFANVYNVRRKDPQLVLLLAAVGFLGVAGIHRFVIGRSEWECCTFSRAALLIGTIVDLINHRRLAFEHNIMVAMEAVKLVKPRCRNYRAMIHKHPAGGFHEHLLRSRNPGRREGKQPRWN